MYLLVQVHRGNPCQLQVPGTCGGQERGLEEILTSLVGGVRDLDSCECVDFIGVVFGPPQVTLAEWIYILIPVQHERLFQLQVPGTHEGHYRVSCGTLGKS